MRPSPDKPTKKPLYDCYIRLAQENGQSTFFEPDRLEYIEKRLLGTNWFAAQYFQLVPARKKEHEAQP